MRAAIVVVLAIGLILSGRGPVDNPEDSLKGRAGLTSRVATAPASHVIGGKVAKGWASAIIMGWIAQGLARPVVSSTLLVAQTAGPLSATLSLSPLGPRPPPAR
jgi:hypothetical protein